MYIVKITRQFPPPVITGGGDNYHTYTNRYYDKNGYADMDIDCYHSVDEHTFPHRHIWNGKKEFCCHENLVKLKKGDIMYGR